MSSEKNDTKIIWFGSVVFTAGMAVHKFSLCFLCTDQWASGQQYVWKSEKNINPWLKCHENEQKIDNDRVLRNDHRIKNYTQPISMILVSFFSEDNVLSDELKIYYIFEYQSNENRAFRFFGTPGIDTEINRHRHIWASIMLDL